MRGQSMRMFNMNLFIFSCGCFYSPPVPFIGYFLQCSFVKQVVQNYLFIMLFYTILNLIYISLGFTLLFFC